MFWLIENVWQSFPGQPVNLLSTLDSGARGVGYQGNVLVARGWQSQKFWVVFFKEKTIVKNSCKVDSTTFHWLNMAKQRTNDKWKQFFFLGRFHWKSRRKDANSERRDAFWHSVDGLQNGLPIVTEARCLNRTWVIDVDFKRRMPGWNRLNKWWFQQNSSWEHSSLEGKYVNPA